MLHAKHVLGPQSIAQVAWLDLLCAKTYVYRAKLLFLSVLSVIMLLPLLVQVVKMDIFLTLMGHVHRAMLHVKHAKTILTAYPVIKDIAWARKVSVFNALKTARSVYYLIMGLNIKQTVFNVIMDQFFSHSHNRIYRHLLVRFARSTLQLIVLNVCLMELVPNALLCITCMGINVFHPKLVLYSHGSLSFLAF